MDELEWDRIRPRKSVVVVSREDRIVRLHLERRDPRLEELCLTDNGWRSVIIALDPEEWAEVFRHMNLKG